MPRVVFPSGRKSILLLAFAVAGIGGAWWWLRPPPEPKSNGVSLSVWMAGSYTDEGRHAEELRAFGPAAVTWLIYTVEHGRHPFIRYGPLPFDNAPDWLRRKLPEKWGGLRRGARQVDERMTAAHALSHLRSEAAPAIPALVKALDSDGDLANAAAFALQAIGPVSWPAVQEVLDHGSKAARSRLIGSIDVRVGGTERPAPDAEVEIAIATLVKAFHDPDSGLRNAAAWSFGFCGRARPDTKLFDAAIPDFIRLLSDPDCDVRVAAVNEIDEFGAKAASGIPRLIELLDDPDAYFRRSAAHALGHMDMNEKRSATRLRVMLQDLDDECRSAAETALKELGDSPVEENASAVAPLAR